MQHEVYCRLQTVPTPFVPLMTAKASEIQYWQNTDLSHTAKLMSKPLTKDSRKMYIFLHLNT